MSYKVTYGKSVHNNKEINAVIRTIKKSTAMGQNVKNFESKIAKIFGKKYCVMVNSGTSALMLLAEIINLKKGDEFITPVVTFPSTIVPFIKKGFVPKFVDVSLNDLQIDYEKLKKSINKKTKAIVIPNLIGNMPRWDKIKKLVKNKNIILVEDSADTIDTKIKNTRSGIFTDYSITSFYGSHIINCAGNGGALLLDNKKKYLKSKILRSWGRLSSITNEKDLKDRFSYKLNNIPYDKKFVFDEMGFNIEPSEIGAAFGIEQLKKLKNNTKLRKENFKKHAKFFNKFKNIFIIPEINKNINTALLAFPLLVRKNKYFKRNDMQIFLEKNKIQTRPIFSGNILLHPGFKKFKYIKSEKDFYNANYITKNGMLIGLHHGINNSDINYMHRTIKKFLELKIKK